MENNSFFPPSNEVWEYIDPPLMSAPALSQTPFPMSPSPQGQAYPAYYAFSPWTEPPQTPDSTPGVGDGWNGAQPSSRRNSQHQQITHQARERRKAQNRAAQRAFRERKENRIKELTGKLSHIETSHGSLAKENEQLRRELVVTIAENELLRVTSPRSKEPSPIIASQTNSPVISPMSIDCPKNLASGLMGWRATFHFIQEQEQWRNTSVNLEKLALKLKQVAKHCDSEALPFFDEADVRAALNQSIEVGTIAGR